MKKTLSTIIVAVIFVLLTATFSFAEYTAGGGENFPYFHLGLVIIGGLIIFSIKQKFEKMYAGEAVGAFALYTFYVALFTAPVIEAIKAWVS
ncbi:MAG TPA: hypothetical protein DCG53_04045 [Syntrophus sp. (in: bacteria)]|nr:hypothetical protein [Syntrophus sp. (in: bacteria)]